MHGRITVTSNGEVWGRVMTLSEAERTVHYALKNGFLSCLAPADRMRCLRRVGDELQDAAHDVLSVV